MPSYGPEILGPPQRDPEQQFWDPEIQTMDPEKLRDLQEQRLRDLVRKIIDTPVPLFCASSPRLASNRLTIIKSLDDIRHIPLTVKQDLRDSETEDPPWGDYRFTDPHKAVRLGTSTGTTGTPTISLWTGATCGSSTSRAPGRGGGTGTGQG